MADLGSIEALKAAIAARIFANTTFEVSADDIDESFIDTIDTLSPSFSAFNDTNYGDLSTAIANSTLVPGAFYAFDYQSIYVVDAAGTTGSGVNGAILNTDVATITEINASGVAVPVAYTVPTEKLIVQAVSTNQLHPQAVSVQNPKDIIIYDVLDNKTEETASTTTRSGFIQYREDPILDIKCEFDFRAAIGHVQRVNESIISRQHSGEPVLAVNNNAPTNTSDPIFCGTDRNLGTILNVMITTRHYFRIFGGFQK